jgi:hypothetical protein
MHVYICMHVCICGFSCIQISVLYIWRWYFKTENV